MSIIFCSSVYNVCITSYCYKIFLLYLFSCSFMISFSLSTLLIFIFRWLSRTTRSGTKDASVYISNVIFRCHQHIYTLNKINIKVPKCDSRDRLIFARRPVHVKKNRRRRKRDGDIRGDTSGCYLIIHERPGNKLLQMKYVFAVY